MDSNTARSIGTNAGAFAGSAIGGAITKHASTPHGRGAIAAAVGSAMGAAGATGAGAGGTIAAGATALKVAVAATVGPAAAPFVIAAGIGYGIYKLGKKLVD